MRRTIVALFLLIVTLGHAQQGAAGYGQGGGFGGGQGGMSGGIGAPGGAPGGGPLGAKSRPDEEDGNWTTRSAILTPGDKVEYKFEVKAGETLFAAATSEAFDPALAVIDPKGKEIAKNDDREEGDQSPFVAVRFPEDGTYLLRVLGYKSASGGKFTLRTLTFRSVDVKLGPTTAEVASVTPGMSSVYGRFTAKKGVVYDLRTALWVQGTNRVVASLRRIVGPTGVGSNDVESIPMPDGSAVFRALRDGDYYFDYLNYGAKQIATDFHEVTVVKTTTSEKTDFELAPGEAKVVEFPVEVGTRVRTTLKGRRLISRMSGPSGPASNEGYNGDPTFGDTPEWAFFLLDRANEEDVVRIFHNGGTARVAFRSQDSRPQTASLQNSERLPVWEAGDAVRGKLGIGEIQLFLMKSSKSELMKVFAKAAAFQIQLDIFDVEGRRQNTLLDRKTHVAADDLYFPEANTYLIRLSCDGYGGSGEYTMRRDIPATDPYRLGENRTLTLDGANFGLYETVLEAGKRYELIVDAPDQPLRVDLLGEDGQFLTSQAIRLDDVIVQYFVPTRSGRHRLWLRGPAATHRFTFRLNVPPKIGGS